MREQVASITGDLQTSWYFRIWALLWVVCFIMWFVNFGILAKESSQDIEQGAQIVRVSLVDSLAFPKFHFRVGDAFKFQNVSCKYNTTDLAMYPCAGGSALDECFAIDGENIKVKRVGGDTRIVCQMGSTAQPSQDVIIAWELEGATNFGTDSYASVWIQSSDDSWVLLTKTVFSSGIEWVRSLLYHSSQAKTGIWGVSVILNSFNVLTYSDTTDLYNGWQAASDFGGFAFFLVILHTLVMLLVSTILTNDSRFLKGDGYNGGQSNL